jgi:hypothetical protein
LGLSGLATVQPLLVLELPATLLLSAKVFSSHLGRREWALIIVMSGALAALLYFLHPGSGRSDVPWIHWFVGSGVTIAVVSGLAAFARRGQADASSNRSGDTRRPAALLGIAAGAGFGLTSAYMKGMTNSFSGGIAGIFSSWQVYVMIAAGMASMFLLQSAFNAGALIAAQPGVTLTDPIVATLWGVLAFHESISGGWQLVLAVVAAMLILIAVVLLVRSPVFSDASRQPEPESGDRQRAVRPR